HSDRHGERHARRHMRRHPQGVTWGVTREVVSYLIRVGAGASAPITSQPTGVAGPAIPATSLHDLPPARIPTHPRVWIRPPNAVRVGALSVASQASSPGARASRHFTPDPLVKMCTWSIGSPRCVSLHHHFACHRAA